MYISSILLIIVVQGHSINSSFPWKSHKRTQDELMNQVEINNMVVLVVLGFWLRLWL